PSLNCQLLVTTTDENREPICVTASDVLTLTAFYPRAVVDFGTENFTNRPFVRYLLLENPHDEDQYVSIRRGLPPDEFMLTWIESEHTLTTQSDLTWKTPGYELLTSSSSAPDSICVRGSHGRCLLRITWNPSQPKSSDNGGGGFYHIIQFRVNDAFSLQALVVGRLLAPVVERKTRLKRSALRRQSVSLPRLPGPQCTFLDESSKRPASSLHRTRPAALNLIPAHATDVGFVSPKLIRSPALKRGAQRRLMSQLTDNYAPIWLHLALDALNGAPVPKSAHVSAVDGVLKLSDPTRLAPPPVPLSQKLRIYLFTGSSVSKCIPTSVPAQSKKPTADPIPQKPAVRVGPRITPGEEAHSRLSSAEMVLLFARNFLTGENNLVRHLVNLGVRLEVTQTLLDEYELTVSNLAVDLRDGIRLVKLAELLLPLMPKPKSRFGDHPDPATLMSLVRFPPINRLQKIHNVGLALKAFERHGRLCMADGTEIDPRDIVNGHREKSLALLWCLLLRYQVLSLVDMRLLDEEIERLRSIPTGDKAPDSSDGEETGTHSDDVVHMKLFLWASFVCRLYQVELARVPLLSYSQVLNLDESFSDGRALCVLLHHYLPTVLPGGLVRHLTTSTASSYHLARRTPHLARTNRYNLQLFQRKLSYLGDVPALLEPSMIPDFGDQPGLLPPALVLATLAYLVSRLISIGRQKLRDLVEDHAARILQTAWRKRQQVLQARNLRLLSCHKRATSPRSHLLTGHIES
ncbi:hypothetical protein X801_05565, partial [Opisthorchis viverrini]